MKKLFGLEFMIRKLNERERIVLKRSERKLSEAKGSKGYKKGLEKLSHPKNLN